MALPDVLIVDDDQLLRTLLKDALRDVPCTVREASSGDLALSLIEQAAPAVVILDLIMPGKSGLEVLKLLKARQVTSKVIVVSALDSEKLVQTAMADGANGYLVKPFHPLDVQNVVRAALEGSKGAPS